jgi:transposase
MTMRRRIDVNLEELDQIIDRSTQAPLSQSEGQKLKTAIHAMAERLSWKRTTEKTSAVLPQDAAPDKPETGKSTPASHGRHSAAAFSGAPRVASTHATLHSGDLCPECRRGKVYRLKEPATLVRFVGHAPLEATVFEMERLRCNACGQIFKADQPDGAGAEKYDETAVAMIALLKYGTGVPFQRLERLQKQLGMPLAAATQWDLMAAAAELIRAALEELIRQAAQGSVMHNDDTGMRILRLTREPGDKRTGTFTSGIVSLVGAWTIALFFTGWKHAGENLAEVLKQRARGLPAPIQMSDALSRNSPKVEGVEPLQANCLAHGRRQVVEVADHFPEECRYVLETLRDVYHHDALAREQAMSPEQRLRFHQDHSGPLMKGLHEWMEAQLGEHKTEPNSGLGKAISYLLNHWPKLTLFLRQPGAPIDNNLVERALKKAILNRKNALFYKTLNGAGVGDLFMSLIHTCELNGANPFDYLTELQRHSEELKRRPSEWMPWNYREALARLATPTAA